MFINHHSNVQHIDLKVPLFGRGDISEDLKSILTTVRYSTLQFASNLVYRSLESTLGLFYFPQVWFVDLFIFYKILMKTFQLTYLRFHHQLINLIHPKLEIQLHHCQRRTNKAMVKNVEKSNIVKLFLLCIYTYREQESGHCHSNKYIAFQDYILFTIRWHMTHICNGSISAVPCKNAVSANIKHSRYFH